MKPLKQLLAHGLRFIGLERLGRALWKRATYLGLRYRCPLCAAYLRAFLPGGEHHAVLAEKAVIGGGLRSNMTCPVCGAIDRERAVCLYLKDRPRLLARGIKLLHVAPEGSLGAWLRSLPELDYVTADLNMAGVDLKMDLTDIDLPDATFDAIICNHVLEHIPNDAKAMSEMLRVLKPGGWAILQTPISASLPHTYEDFSITDPTERERAFGQDDHVRIYAMDYVDRLKRAGFEVQAFCSRSGEDVAKFGLIEKEYVFLASRNVASGAAPSL
jgi:SAM-dependent methyltransferase